MGAHEGPLSKLQSVPPSSQLSVNPTQTLQAFQCSVKDCSRQHRCLQCLLNHSRLSLYSFAIDAQMALQWVIMHTVGPLPFLFSETHFCRRRMFYRLSVPLTHIYYIKIETQKRGQLKWFKDWLSLSPKVVVAPLAFSLTAAVPMTGTFVWHTMSTSLRTASVALRHN